MFKILQKSLLLTIFTSVIMSCGPSQAELDAHERAYIDSIENLRIQESIAYVNNMKLEDSIKLKIKDSVNQGIKSTSTIKNEIDLFLKDNQNLERNKNLISLKQFVNRFKKRLKFKIFNNKIKDSTINNYDAFNIYGNIISGLGNSKFQFFIKDEAIKVKYPTAPIICEIKKYKSNNDSYFVFPIDNSICLIDPNKNLLFFGCDTFKYEQLRIPNKIQIFFNKTESLWSSTVNSKSQVSNKSKFKYEVY